MRQALFGMLALIGIFSLAANCGSQPRHVPIRFELAIPEPLQPGEMVYLSGSFNDWQPDDSNWIMHSLDSLHYFRDTILAENSRIEYKYSLGTWFHGETDTSGNDLPNRSLTVYSNLLVNDSIMKWKNDLAIEWNGDTTQLLAAIDGIMAPFSHPDQPGAGLMIIHDSRIIVQKGYGLADLEHKIPVTPAANFRLASVSKQFTAMSIMLLVQQGSLKLNQNLLDFFPDFPEIGRKITLRHLLNHTSGLIDYETINPEQWTHDLKDKDVLDLLKTRTDTYFEPGTQYRYSNSAYALLALIAEKTSGQSYSDYLQTAIFEPLGMNRSVALEEGINQVENRAYGYKQKKEDGSFYLADQSKTSRVLGDGGIYSSVEDLYQWDQALRQKKLVSEEIYHQIFTPSAWIEGHYYSYGFGWKIRSYRGMSAVFHTGSSIGFNTAIFRLSDRPLTVIILINRDSVEPMDYVYPILDLMCFPSKP
ncbi:MAG: serine hydrolase [Candidatus Delongbacteria bacterium]|nr:serine hydrolase [Candidatus Delongbacteria bacterium]